MTLRNWDLVFYLIFWEYIVCFLTHPHPFHTHTKDEKKITCRIRTTDPRLRFRWFDLMATTPLGHGRNKSCFNLLHVGRPFTLKSHAHKPSADCLFITGVDGHCDFCISETIWIFTLTLELKAYTALRQSSPGTDPSKVWNVWTRVRDRAFLSHWVPSRYELLQKNRWDTTVPVPGYSCLWWQRNIAAYPMRTKCPRRAGAYSLDI